jgi:hypothetical protein
MRIGGTPKIPFFALLCLARLTSVLWAAEPDESASESWSLERQADGIDVFTRPVPGSAVKAFKGEGIVEADLETVLAVLRDSDHYQDWFPNCPESKLLKREGPLSFQYSVTEAPWPVTDRDNIFRSVLMRDESTGHVEISVTAAPDAYPEQPDRVRVRLANGGWRLAPEGRDRTRVVFTMHLEPGGGVPIWMVNARILSTPFEAITNLRRVVANAR